MSDNDDLEAKRRILLGFYRDLDSAEAALRGLLDADFAPDRISLLGKASSSGDDPLGVYYASPGERMKAWAPSGVARGSAQRCRRHVPGARRGRRRRRRPRG